MPEDNIIPFKPKPERKGESLKRQHPPMLNLPLVTKILAAFLIGAHLVLWGLSLTLMPNIIGTIIQWAGFIPANWTNGDFGWTTPLSIISFSFLHDGWLHLGVNILMLVAIGSGIEKALGRKDFLLIYMVCTIFAALSHLAFAPFSTMPVIGASGGVSGLFGAMIYLTHTNQNSAIGRQARSIMPIVLLWIGISAIGGFLGAPNGSSVAWIAHIGGFLSGIGIMMILLKRQR